MIAWEAHVDDYLRLRRQLGFTLVWDEHERILDAVLRGDERQFVSQRRILIRE